MRSIRQNAIHIVTLILFTGLLIHSTQNPDPLGWIILFLLIEFNAALFIIYKPLSTLAWITIFIGILGLLMSTPQLVSLGLDYVKGEPDLSRDNAGTVRSAVYFSISALFSFLQIHRMIK